MKLIDEVKHNPNTLQLFVNYLITKSYDINKIVTSDTYQEVVCYYLEFLETQDVYIISEHNGYGVYKQFDSSQQLIIACELIPKQIVPKLIAGIIKAFDYLENPF